METRLSQALADVVGAEYFSDDLTIRQAYSKDASLASVWRKHQRDPDAVPTMVAGLYGMNFDILPGMHDRQGFGLISLALLIVCGGLWVVFRRSNWL